MVLNNFEQIKTKLLEAIIKCQNVLEDPKPVITINALTSSGVELLITAWAKNTDSSLVKNGLQEAIQLEIEQQAISLPCPQMTVKQVP